jgi:uncharacterized protein (DUF1786 family)
MKILAVDVGTGTQDILLFDTGTQENRIIISGHRLELRRMGVYWRYLFVLRSDPCATLVKSVKS